MVSSSKIVDPQKLPPTQRSAHFDSLRVHLQVMLWKRLTHEDLEFDPERWSWKLDGTRLSPIMTDLAAAPEALLKFVGASASLLQQTPVEPTPVLAASMALSV